MKLIRKLIPLIVLLIISSFVVAEEDSFKTDGHKEWTVVKTEDKGGRVAWHKGKNHNLIAFDSITDVEMKNTDVFVMQPNGNEKTNLTARSLIPRGFIGQPAWHPGGKHLVIQAENTNSKHRLLNHMAWGINNDLWIINKDGTEAQLIWSSSLNHAALHPHFNKDGTKIIFAQRTATGKSWRWIRRLNLGAGGENQWDGWNIHLADFDIGKRGKNMLSNHKTLSPNGRGFYETHGFTDDGKLIYSFTPNGQAYVDDIYVCDEDGTNVKKLIDSPATWDEHGIFSPSGKSMAFISSRGDKNWSAPKSKANTLRTELYLKQSGQIIQLTDFNKKEEKKKRFLVSDYDWNASGNKIVFQVAPFIGNRSESPELWMLTFPVSQ